MPVYVAHRLWFTYALASELADATLDVDRAGSKTAGSAGRMAAALQNLEDIEAFLMQLEALKHTNGFAGLKKAVDSTSKLEDRDYHILEVGNYRGHFAVDAAAVYQALFSRAPHDAAAIQDAQKRMEDFYAAIRKFEGH